jgi:hypothetical protein
LFCEHTAFACEGDGIENVRERAAVFASEQRKGEGNKEKVRVR